MKRKYTDNTKQAVYENSMDCIRYGYGFSYLNRCGLSEDEARMIWNKAYEYMANNF